MLLLPGYLRLLRRICLFLAASSPLMAGAQARTQADHDADYARVNTFGVLAAYSNDSSHMLLGNAERRKLLNIGGMYSRRLFLNRVVNWEYTAEVLPAALESDPLSRQVNIQTLPSATTLSANSVARLITCRPIVSPYDFTYMGVEYAGTFLSYCHGRQWTIGEAASPIGFSWNFRTRHPLQPFLIAHGGYMYSTRAIPVEDAGSFNFTFDFGVGIEFFRTHSRSLRAEYRYHHISNDYTAGENPGIDSGLVQLTWCVGK